MQNKIFVWKVNITKFEFNNVYKTKIESLKIIIAKHGMDNTSLIISRNIDLMKTLKPQFSSIFRCRFNRLSVFYVSYSEVKLLVLK